MIVRLCKESFWKTNYVFCPTGDGEHYIGQIGRTVSGGNIDVHFNYEVTHDLASGGIKLTVTWDGNSNQVFQDCLYFGNYTLLESVYLLPS